MSDLNEERPENGESSLEQPHPAAAPPPSSNRNWIVIGVMAVALAGMIYVGLHSPRRSGSGLYGDVQGKAAPDFELKDVTTGKAVKLSDYRGKAVVLNFWATWCPPCKAEIPWFVDLQKQYGPDGLVVVGVAMDDSSQQDISKFAQDMGINYPVLLGNDKVDTAYGGVDGLPTTFYIGRDGKIVDRVEGLRSHHEIESNIKAALAQGGTVAQRQNELVIQ
jgi:thiol-disulfide isomerase/thioredoxin